MSLKFLKFLKILQLHIWNFSFFSFSKNEKTSNHHRFWSRQDFKSGESTEWQLNKKVSNYSKSQHLLTFGQHLLTIGHHTCQKTHLLSEFFLSAPKIWFQLKFFTVIWCLKDCGGLKEAPKKILLTFHDFWSRKNPKCDKKVGQNSLNLA